MLNSFVSHNTTAETCIKTPNRGDVNSEHIVHIEKSATVEALRKAVCDAVSANGMGVRLIASGKMLSPPSKPISDCNLHQNSVIHAVLTSVSQGAPATPTSHAVQRRSGDPRGFDRLSSRGFSSDDILSFRTFFASEVREFAQQNQQDALEEGESELDRSLRWEDMWLRSPRAQLLGDVRFDQMEAGVGREVVDDNEVEDAGTTRDFIWGFMLGFFFGVIMLFWIWEHGSYRQKMGIMTGVSCQLSLRYLKSMWSEASQVDDAVPP